MSSERLTRRSLPTPRRLVRQIGSGLVVCLLLFGGFWGAHILAPEDPDIQDDEPAEKSLEFQLASAVTLTQQKQASARISVSQPQLRDVQEMITVAATIDYDTTRHIVLKAPVECVVEQVHVKPGQQVSRAEPLVVLNSSEIALARAQVCNTEAELRLAQIHCNWTRETRESLQDLLTVLKTQPSIAEIEDQFNGKRLGKYRDQVLASYNQLLLARTVVARTQPLSEQGVVPGRTSETRLSQRDEASSAFRASCEQSEYESHRELTGAEAALEVARRKLTVAQERLRMMLGPFGEDCATETQGEFVLRAPFAGRIETLHTAQSARHQAEEPILAIADPTQLRVSALIHQHDWEALTVAEQETLTVRVPAFPNKEFPAQVSFVGPELSPTTRAVSLVARLDNSLGQFRPGMFAWVSIPVEASRQSLTVPPSAVQRHESSAFVFVKVNENRFERVPVETGISTATLVEITDGLSADQLVVNHGAFYLKSELLLEQEED